ncbi:MAG: ATP-binding protein [Promethearchaeota archaeon]
MSEDEIEKKYKRAASAIIKAGTLPFVVTDTFIEILKRYLDEKEAEFIGKYFKLKKSLSHEQLKKKSKLSDEEIKEIIDKLAKKGFIFNQPSSSGIMVYRLMPIVAIGSFEYTYMKKLPDDPNEKQKLKKLADLYHKLMLELRDNVQKGYDNLLPIFEKLPEFDRTVPTLKKEDGKTINIVVDKTIEAEEQVLPTQSVEEIINKFDDIAVGNCFCRNYQKMLGHNCEWNAPMEVCFTFGKSARHTIQQGFMRRVSKEEALKILKQAEEAGLVHKAFHNRSDIYQEENSICNCCKDCCDTFNLWRMGALGMWNSTNYISMFDQEKCIGCGECVKRCPIDIIELNENNKAERTQEYCIGCALCARFCPEDAIYLKEGLRRVYVPPPRVK